MPATQTYVRTDEDVRIVLEKCFNAEGKAVVLFEGSTDVTTGDSWSEPCRKVEELLEPMLQKAPETIHFFMIEVGEESEWKDANNKFKKDPVFQLTGLPSLLLMEKLEVIKSRLEGEACLNADALKTFF